MVIVNWIFIHRKYGIWSYCLFIRNKIPNNHPKPSHNAPTQAQFALWYIMYTFRKMSMIYFLHHHPLDWGLLHRRYTIYKGCHYYGSSPSHEHGMQLPNLGIFLVSVSFITKELIKHNVPGMKTWVHCYSYSSQLSFWCNIVSTIMANHYLLIRFAVDIAQLPFLS